MRRLWALCAMALLGTVLLLGGWRYRSLYMTEQQAAEPAVRELAEGLLFARPRPVQWPALELHTGATLSPAQLNGQWTLVSFGYTSCPDICPTTLAVLKQVLDALEREQLPRPQVLFISVDPRRDSRARLQQYVPWFDARFLGARGTPSELAELARQLAQPYLPVPHNAQGNYAVAHSARLMLIDPAGRYAGYLYRVEAVNPVLESLRSLLQP